MKAHKEGVEVRLYFFDGSGWLMSSPGRFNPWKETRYPSYRRLGGSQGRSVQVRKISPPPGFDPRTVRPIASLYTDYAIPAHNLKSINVKLHNI
jgi:hypothetical protein